MENGTLAKVETELIAKLVQLAITARLIAAEDAVYVCNQILYLLGLDKFPIYISQKMQELQNLPLLSAEQEVDLAKQLCKKEEEERQQAAAMLPAILAELVAKSVCSGIKEKITAAGEDILAARIMNVFLPLPAAVNKQFNALYAQSPMAATAYFYRLSKDSNYIQTKAVARNISYKAETAYGEIDITINLSKPEKNPLDIIAAGKQHSSKYPQCLLCLENEGYAGRFDHPARSNHRLIKLELSGERWYLQYSPYVYYNEHCIVLAAEHRPMKIDKAALQRLLEFVTKFPHYFLGSNADLPIVGGSILSHDHYQGGCYEFAMAKAQLDFSCLTAYFAGVECAVLKWPLAVLRLSSKNKEKLLTAAAEILNCWRQYNDPAAEIYAATAAGKIFHNTVTPIARQKQGVFELDLVLRNNRTSEQHPLGIFHPHADVQHIKKENIGLIEVMGLAVLPARLEEELKSVGAYVLGREVPVADYHLAWAQELRERYAKQAADNNIATIIRNETAVKFSRVLTDAGVFKHNAAGKAAWYRFLEEIQK